MKDLAVSVHDRRAASRNSFIFLLFSSDPLVLQQLSVRLAQLSKQGLLLMGGGQQPILMGTEFVQLRLEELVLLVGNGFFIQDKDI